MSAPPLFLDACCAINLLACDVGEEILSCLPYTVWAVSVVVDQEVLHVRGEEEEGGTGSDPTGAEPVRRTLQPWVDGGLILVAKPETDEERGTYVDLALQLDDGEAMTGALAIHREACLATDDRKAIRLLSERMPDSRILRTSHLVRSWAERSASDDQVRAALQAIERVGSFRPPADDPNRDWWRGLVPTVS